MPKHQRTLLTLLAACSFEPAMRDLLQVPDPQVRSSSVCNAWNDILFAPEGEGGGSGGGGAAGDEKKFTQADVDKIVQDRVKGLKEKVTALETQTGRITEIEAKLAEADAREQTAREEAELKGKSDVDKLKHQLSKAEETYKKSESEWSKKVADKEASERAWADKYTTHVKTSAVVSALRGAGVAPKADDDAALSFLREAQIEFGEDGASISRLTVGGKSFDKIGEAASHFLKEKPHFAAPPEGGSGSPRGNNGAGAAPANSLVGLLSQSPDGRA